MVSDLWDSLTSYVKDRAVSPLTGALVVSWLVWNHRAVITLFSSKPIPTRFGYIDAVIYPNIWSFVGLVFVGPILSALAYLFLYHKPALWVYRRQLEQRAEMVDARNKAEGARLLTQAEAEKLTRRTTQIVQREKERVRLTEERVGDLESTNVELVRSLSVANARLNQLRASNEALPVGSVERDDAVRALLVTGSWVLHYNPSASLQKPISFSVAGDVVEGRNEDEWSWQVIGGRLNIYAKDGELYSVFVYSAAAGAFRMVDGEGAVAKRNLSGHFIAAA